MSKNNLILAVLLLLMTAVTWGGVFAVAKSALTVMDPYYMTLIRYGTAAIIFMMILIVVEGKQAVHLEGRTGILLSLSTLGFAGFNLMAFNGLTHTRPEHGAVIMGLMPMITALMTWVTKGAKPNPFTMSTIVAAFLGVSLVITGGHPVEAFTGGAAKWDLLFLAGAFCWVSYTMGAQLFPTWSPLRYTAITCILGSISIGAITLLLTLNKTLKVPTLGAVISLRWEFFYLTVVGGVLAVLSWNTGIKMMGPVNGVLFINFVPVTAFTIGVLNGDSFALAEVLGAGLVVVALITNNLYMRDQERKKQFFQAEHTIPISK